MNDSQSDALVFFGATGDLAYKKIFPALHAMVKRGTLHVPVIGVARPKWTFEQFRARAYESMEKHGGVDRAVFEKFAGLLHYVGGDYSDPATFDALRRELAACHHPAHYLAIPPVLFGPVVRQLAKTGGTEGARVIVEKPFGTDLVSARALNAILLEALPEKAIFRIDHYLGKNPVDSLVYLRFANSLLEPFWNRTYVQSIQLTMAEDFGIEDRGAFYDQTGAIRDVVENHLLQVLTNLTMEPPIRMDSESIRDEKVKVVKAIPPLSADNVVRGQYRSYRSEKGVAADSNTETFAAVRLEIDSWRWQGVPIFIRAGKCLPVSCTELLVRLRRPPNLFPAAPTRPNHFRLRISPDVTMAFGVMMKSPSEEMRGNPIELLARMDAVSGEMEAYERLLTEAMAGDATLFAREDYIEEAWRIVDPVLKANPPLSEYQPGSWGPAEAQRLSPPEGWHNPVIQAPLTAGTETRAA